jgi:hypothetical protein
MKRSLTCLLALILILAGVAGAASRTSVGQAYPLARISMDSNLVLPTGTGVIPSDTGILPTQTSGGGTAPGGSGAASGGSGSSAAASSSGGTYAPCLTQGAGYAAGTISLALLALTISFDVIAIAYVINKLFPTTGIKDWISTEYWEIAKTAMLIAGIYAALTFLGNAATLIAPSAIVAPVSGSVSSGYDYTGMSNLVNGACSYLNRENGYMGTTLNFMIALSESIGLFKQAIVGWSLPIPLPGPSVLQSGFAMNIYWNKMISSEVNQNPYQSLLNDMLNMVVFPVTLAIEAQIQLLPALFAIGLGALIPAGLLLRAFPFVRGIGGTLIAIGIGVSLIYPATLVLFNYPITIALQGPALTSVTPAQPCSGNWIICGASGAVFEVLQAFQAPGAGNAPADAVQALETIFPAFNDILYYGSYTILQFFLFVMDLAIIFPLVDNMAKMLGGKVSLSIGGRLKLV